MSTAAARADGVEMLQHPTVLAPGAIAHPAEYPRAIPQSRDHPRSAPAAHLQQKQREPANVLTGSRHCFVTAENQSRRRRARE